MGKSPKGRVPRKLWQMDKNHPFRKDNNKLMSPQGDTIHHAIMHCVDCHIHVKHRQRLATPSKLLRKKQ